jgi:hypothetical protein
MTRHCGGGIERRKTMPTNERMRSITQTAIMQGTNT